MTRTKWPLLCVASLAAMATAAQADELGTLKAQLEELDAQITRLEAQPQASMPSGYSLVEIRDGQGTYEGVLPERNADRVREESGFTMSILPTADAAPMAEVSVSGEIRTALIYSDFDSDADGFPIDDNLDVKVRGRIFIKGKVDTAVGEVGGYFRLQADGGGNFSDYSEATKMNKAYGWWKFAPNWELMAGYNDNTGALQVGWDWLAASGPVSSFGPSNINNEQMRLTYSSGPLSFAIALEDPEGSPFDGDRSDLPNLEGYVMYTTDSLTLQVVAIIQDDDFGLSDDLDWAIGGGGTVTISDGFLVTAGAVFGEGINAYSNQLVLAGPDAEFWAASIGVLANLSEDTRLELGVGYEDYDGQFIATADALGIGGGIYWDPVSQVTLGAGATYIDTDFDDDFEDDSLEVFFGTWLRFP